MKVKTDVVIIGAGPSGLFQCFELGLLGIDAHIVDSLPVIGGQCSMLYPDKAIYDIPGLPIVGAQELIDRLAEQLRRLVSAVPGLESLQASEPKIGGQVHHADPGLVER